MSRRGGSIRSAVGPLLHSSILFRPHQHPRESRLMVEAPGYCPPGPKCLFHLTVYRHSRRTGTRQIGILRVNLKNSAVIAVIANRLDGEWNVMKRLAFVTLGTVSLVLSACNNSNQDAVQNAELNQPNAEQLNDLAAQAA